MKKVILFILLLSLFSCMGAKNRRMAFVKNNDTQYKSEIMEGKLAEGMNKEEVRAVLGRPDDTKEARIEKTKMTTWYYRKENISVTFEDQYVSGWSNY